MLDASVSGDDVILEVIRLDAELCEVAEEVLVDHLELAAEHSPGVDVAGIRLHTLFVAENLGGVTPCLAILALSAAQSWRLVGVTPHMSYWRIPLDTLLPCPQSRTRLPKLRSKSSQRYAC